MTSRWEHPGDRGPWPRRSVGWVWVALVGVRGALAAEAGAEIASLEALRERMQTHLTQPRFSHAHWGLHVVSLETGRTVFRANQDKLFIPASTTKLFIGALALDQLGPEYRIRTSLYSVSPPDARGVLEGDLVLYGRGDPSLDVEALGGDWDRALAPLIEPLVTCGLKRVRGNLVADESYFRGARVGSGWEYDDLRWYYAPEVTALSVNDNAVQVMVRPARRPGLPAEVLVFPSTREVAVRNFVKTVSSGVPPRVTVQRAMEANVVTARGALPLDTEPITESIAVSEPGGWLGREFKRALERRGIRVRGSVVTVAAPELAGPPGTPDPRVELGGYWSPPLRELLPRMMKPSENLHAQLLLFQVGAQRPEARDTDRTSEEVGLEALSAFLAKLGLDRTEARFGEGTGLSRHNLVTPRALVRLLQFMRSHPHGAVFQASLPVAGLDGTLRTRLRGTPAEGNLRAKTGSLSLVNTLAGYVTTAAGEPLAFAILLNHYAAQPGARPGRAEIDDLAVMLASLRQHTQDALEAAERQSDQATSRP